jgi:hypothetical protein
MTEPSGLPDGSRCTCADGCAPKRGGPTTASEHAGSTHGNIRLHCGRRSPMDPLRIRRGTFCCDTKLLGFF